MKTSACNSPRRCLRPHQGFSFVEILIVCVVVALFSALLLSVFSQTRGRTRKVGCIGNLKQIGLAIQMYANNNSGRFPNNPIGFAGSNCAWADMILPYTRTTAVFVCPEALNTPYVPGCGPDGSSDLEAADDLGFPNHYDGSYDMNALSQSRFMSEATFKHPSDTISVLDGDGQFVIAAFGGIEDPIMNHVPAVQKPRHQGGNNILFLDGHAKWMSVNVLKDHHLWTVASLSR